MVCWIWFWCLACSATDTFLAIFVLLGSGYLSCKSSFSEFGSLACQCYLSSQKSSRTPISRCPRSCPKMGFQFSGFLAEIVRLYFLGFGPKNWFCPEARIKLVISANFCLANLALLYDALTGYKTGLPLPSRLDPRYCTTSRAHKYAFRRGTTIRQAAVTSLDQKRQTRRGNGFCSLHGNKAPI